MITSVRLDTSPRRVAAMQRFIAEQWKIALHLTPSGRLDRAKMRVQSERLGELARQAGL